MQSNKGLITKERILECSAKLFLINGYHNTGINDILKELELPKGCFYYHFHSKKDLAIQVAEYYANDLRTRLQAIASIKDWNIFAEKFADIFIDKTTSNTCFGCPFAVLGSELAFFDPQISRAFQLPLKELIHLFYTVFLSSGFSEEVADSCAAKAFALFEGYLMYFRITKDISVLYRMKQQLLEIGNKENN